MTWAAIVATGCLEVPDRASPVDAGPDDVRSEDGRPPDMPPEADAGPPPDGAVVADAAVDPDGGPAPDGAVAADMALEVDGPPAVVFDMAPMVDAGDEPDAGDAPDIGGPIDLGPPLDAALPPLGVQFRVDDELVETADFGTVRLGPAGTEVDQIVQILSLGPGPAEYLEPALQVDVRSGGAVTIETQLLGDLPNGATVNVSLTWEPVPGPLDATLTLSTDRGEFSVELVGFAWQPVHVMGTNDGAVAVDPGLGAVMVEAMPGIQGRVIGDIACGGRCTDLGPDEVADSACVVALADEGGRDSPMRVSEDGVTWVSVDLAAEARRSSMRAVDYGPPWAATNGVEVFVSDDGFAWQPRGSLPDNDLEIGVVTDIAVNNIGRIVVTSANGYFWSFTREGPIPNPRRIQGSMSIRRIADGPQGVFMAVGGDGDTLYMDANAANVAYRQDQERHDFVDVGQSPVEHGHPWRASDGASLWSTIDAVNGWARVTREAGIIRFAAADHGILAVTGLNTLVAVPYGAEEADVLEASAPFTTIAAARLCPTGRFDRD